MTWFEEKFLPSFEVGKQIEISEQQFEVFEEHLPYTKERGHEYYAYGTVNGLRVEACRVTCMLTYKYYVTIK